MNEIHWSNADELPVCDNTETVYQVRIGTIEFKDICQSLDDAKSFAKKHLGKLGNRHYAIIYKVDYCIETGEITGMIGQSYWPDML